MVRQLLTGTRVPIRQPGNSEHSEDEVMATLVLKEGRTLGPADVVHFCQANMTYLIVPRFVEFAAQLPMTEKVEKYKLRAAAESRLSEIWDREKAGIKISR